MKTNFLAWLRVHGLSVSLSASTFTPILRVLTSVGEVRIRTIRFCKTRAPSYPS